MSSTDTAPKALKPKDAAYIVSDDRGLYVEVLPSGSILRRYRYRLDGKREELMYAACSSACSTTH